MADHVRLYELPFCGLLLDTREHQVHRLSVRAVHTLRNLLTDVDSAHRYDALIADEAADEEVARGIVEALLTAGFVHRT
ncbi:hypothetical protein NKH77_48560 [Streptomyces sp. M19]